MAVSNPRAAPGQEGGSGSTTPRSKARRRQMTQVGPRAAPAQDDRGRKNEDCGKKSQCPALTVPVEKTYRRHSTMAVPPRVSPRPSLRRASSVSAPRTSASELSSSVDVEEAAASYEAAASCEAAEAPDGILPGDGQAKFYNEDAAACDAVAWDFYSGLQTQMQGCAYQQYQQNQQWQQQQHYTFAPPVWQAEISGDFFHHHSGMFVQSPPIAVGIDDATANFLSCAWHRMMYPQYEEHPCTAVEESAEAEADEDDSAANRSTEDCQRSAASVGRRWSAKLAQDMILVKAKRGVPGPPGRQPKRRAGDWRSNAAPAPPDEPQVASKEAAESDFGASSEASASLTTSDVGTVSALQLKSVRLLQDLRDTRAVSSSLPDAARGRAAGRPGTGLAADGLRATPRTRMKALPPSCPRPKSTPQRPVWKTSSGSKERRIPPYDALLDSECPALTSPARLKQLMHTRELPDEYMYIVRSRYEQHRRLYDPGCDGGERRRPLDPPRLSSRPQRAVASVPQSLVPGAALSVGSAGAADGDLVEPEPRPHTQQASLAVACSPDWCNSALHTSILRREQGHAQNVDAGGLDEPSSDDLLARWESLCCQIESLWFRLQTPFLVQKSIRDSLFKEVTPVNLHHLEMHLQLLLEYEADTRRIISDWIEWEALLESLRKAKVLSVNDARLEALRSTLSAFDELSCVLARSISSWSRHFSALAVDATRCLGFHGTDRLPRAVFVWGGRSCAERLLTDTQALARGDLDADPTSAAQEAAATARPAGAAVARGAGQRQAVARGMRGVEMSLPLPSPRRAGRRPRPGQAQSNPLVASTMTKQRFGVNDVLHQGLPAPWYRPDVAKAGAEALRRGVFKGPKA